MNGLSKETLEMLADIMTAQIEQVVEYAQSADELLTDLNRIREIQLFHDLQCPLIEDEINEYVYECAQSQIKTEKDVLKEITHDDFLDCYSIAYGLLKDICDESVSVHDGDWDLNNFKFYTCDPDGTVIAEHIGGTGPREPALIWSGGIVYDVHDGRWFTSEDASEVPAGKYGYTAVSEMKLGQAINEIAPVGLGGW